MWLAIYLTVFIWAVAGGVGLVRWLAQPETEPVVVAMLVEEPSRGGWVEMPTVNSMQLGSSEQVYPAPVLSRLNETEQLETQRAEDERLAFTAAQADTHKSNVVHVWVLGSAFAVERSGGYGPDGLWCYHVYENGHQAILPLNSETAANVRRFWRQLK